VAGWVTSQMLLPDRPAVAAVLEAAPRLAPMRANGRPCPVRLASMLAEAHGCGMNSLAFPGERGSDPRGAA
jgi:hypothetical protein